MSKSADITECSLCRDVYIDPKVLPCVHTFCLQCLEKYGKDRDPGEMLSCPLCRIEFAIPIGGLVDLPNNHFVEKRLEIDRITSIVQGEKIACETCEDEDESEDDNESGKKSRKNEEKVKEKKTKNVAQVYCLECQQHMCVRCQKAHDKMRFNRAHKVIQPGKVKSEGLMKMTSSLCDRHADEPLKHFCLDCSIVICLSCYVEGHSNHKCSNIGKEAEVTRVRIQEDIDKVVQQSDKLLAVAKELETEEKSLNRKVSDTCEAIENRLEEAKRILDLQAKGLKEEVQAAKNVKMKEIDAAKELNSRHQLMMDTFTRYAQEVKDQATDSELLRCAKTLEARAADLTAVHTASDFSAIKIEFTPQAGRVGEIRTKKCNTFVTDQLQLYKSAPRQLMNVLPTQLQNAIVTLTQLRNELYCFSNASYVNTVNQQIANLYIYMSTTGTANVATQFPIIPQTGQHPTCLYYLVNLTYQMNDSTVMITVSDAQTGYGQPPNHPCVVAQGNFAGLLPNWNEAPKMHPVKLRVQNLVSVTVDLSVTYSASAITVDAANLKISGDVTAPASVSIPTRAPGILSSLPIEVFDALNYQRHRQGTHFVVAPAQVIVCDVTSCSYYNRLYVGDKENSLVHIINLNREKVSSSNQWKILAPPSALSVTPCYNVIVATSDNRIYELSPADGKTLREIILNGITNLQRAIRLTDGSDLEDQDEFLLMHGLTNANGPYTVQVVLATGEKKTFPKVDGNLLETAVDMTFDDPKDCVFILGQDGKIRVVNMNGADVEISRELLTLSDHSLQGSNRMYLDKGNGRLLVWTSGGSAVPGVFDVTTENLDDELMKSIKM